MQEKRRSEKWVRCPYCNHKLFKELSGEGDVLIEVKCHSCKRIFDILLGNDVDKE